MSTLVNKKRKSNDAKSPTPAAPKRNTKSHNKGKDESSRHAESTSLPFRATLRAADARRLTDGYVLTTASSDDSKKNKDKKNDRVILPWVGFGTYKLGKEHVYQATLNALQAGYRCIDTAFIYGGETTELAVGKAMQAALSDPEMPLQHRSDVFVITKHWRKYHGYEATLQCLHKSLKRLQLDYVDLYLMHWPGPAYTTMHRRKDVLEQHGPWHYCKTSPADMPALRAATWRAMEDALTAGLVRAIGVSNFTVLHLETLKQTARIWPPAVNQIECHPLFPQDELRAYCQREGIVVQAYAALGGQDGTKKQWNTLLGSPQTTLRNCDTVQQVAEQVSRTPAQVLLRYALQQNCAVTPKTVQHLAENAQIFEFALTSTQMQALQALASPQGRLCWRNDPLRDLDFA